MRNPKTPLCLALFVGIVFSACKKDLETTDSGSVTSNATYAAETSPAVQKAIYTSINSNTGGYYEALPAGYNSTSRRYPLIVSIHGGGELGNGSGDLYKIANVGIPKLLRDRVFPPNFYVNNENYSFIVIAPQFRNWPSPVNIRTVIEYAKSRYRIDATRIYVTGFSMGGGVCWDYAGAYGNVAAALVPCAGAYSPSDYIAQRIVQFSLPVWAAHNQDDPVVPYSYTSGWISKINSRGANPQALFTSSPTGGHDSWSRLYDHNFRVNGRNVYEWMLQYHR